MVPLVIYDCYGLDVNAGRAPYGYTDVIARGPAGELVRRKVNGVELYPSTRHLFDRFGNIVIGINENGSLYVREPSLPLALDRFNRPVKRPLG